MSDTELIKKAVDIAGVPGVLGSLSYILILLIYPEMSKEMTLSLVGGVSASSGVLWNEYLKIETKKNEEENYKKMSKRLEDKFIAMRTKIESDTKLTEVEKNELRKKSYEKEMESK